MYDAVRRFLAAGDIGLAYPMAAVVVKACCDNAVQLGLPEARLPLAQAVIFLATLPKSNSAYNAYAAAAACYYCDLFHFLVSQIRSQEYIYPMRLLS